jgi:hypothetical protein
MRRAGRNWDGDDWCDEDDDWVEPPPNPDRRYLQVVVYP